MAASIRYKAGAVAFFICIVAIIDYCKAKPTDRSTVPFVEKSQQYLAQTVCVNEQGVLLNLSPFDAHCKPRLQRLDDRALVTKHDFASIEERASKPAGYEASASVVATGIDGLPLVVQTFDFKHADGSFGTFDKMRGDGGQVVKIGASEASLALTEDGSGGVQWFVGPSCVSNGTGVLGWLLFTHAISVNISSEITRLSISNDPLACPKQLNDAFTRFRIISAPVEISFRRSIEEEAIIATRRLPVVVSEHYGGPNVQTANHLERSYFAEGLGWFRWERWEGASVAHGADVAARGAKLRGSERCPRLAWMLEESEFSGNMVDCRSWTNLIGSARPLSVDDFNWPVLRQFVR